MTARPQALKTRETNAHLFIARRTENLRIAGAQPAAIDLWTRELKWGEKVEPPSGMEAALYRYFDADGLVIYIGKTSQAIPRRTLHYRVSAWAIFATRTETAWYPTSEDVDAAEVAAIRSEQPVFNRVHNSSADAQQRMIDYLRRHDRMDLVPRLLRRSVWDRLAKEDCLLALEVKTGRVRRIGDELWTKARLLAEFLADSRGEDGAPSWLAGTSGYGQEARLDWWIFGPIERMVAEAEEQLRCLVS